jgi:predicted dehydrogenase
VLRGAISGFGEVSARGHLAGWSARPGVQIVAIHDPIAARRHAAINLLRNIRVYDNLELMLDGERVDFLDIASPPAYHATAARLALAAGVNVLVEKPLCLTRGEFASLRQEAVTAARVLMCVHNWKYALAYQRAQALISSGRLGALAELTLIRLRHGPAGSSGIVGGGERWRLDPRVGGGILIDHGWHTAYLAQSLIGGVQPSAVSARFESAPGSEVDEVADLRVEFPAGKIARIFLSWRGPARRTSAVIRGTDATLEIEDNRLTLTSRSGLVEDCSVVDALDDSYHPSWFAGMAAEFERAIAHGSDAAIAQHNLAEAEDALAMIVAARESNRLGGALIRLDVML